MKEAALWEEYLEEWLSNLMDSSDCSEEIWHTDSWGIQLNYHYSSPGLNGTYVMIQKAKEDKEQNLICLAGLIKV